MYTAHRDNRFYYVGDVIAFIEERQCVDCVFANDPEEPMCDEIAGDIILERPCADLDDEGDDGVVCAKYQALPEPEPVREEPDPNQSELF